ncbi:MAG: HD-GYP domain-containing protein [Armatimonadota bacterium]|nr:HD-GYP domain-containing protein [Armatimonadota bacterium]
MLLSLAALSIYVSRVYLPARIKAAYLKSITVLAAAVETRDSGTLGHAQRVAELTTETARRLGLQGHDLERIQYAALIMDMGKARVPHALLNKKDPLTPEEWEVLKSHPKLSAEMIGAVPFLADLTDIVLHHHELWDGSGYPDGLAGEQIPLASRILCVAADYDAMISERPYHVRPLSPDEAAQQIRLGSGTRYDPRVVEVFLEVVGTGQAAEPQSVAA